MTKPDYAEKIMHTIAAVICISFFLLAIPPGAEAATASICGAKTDNLASNCGFETGDFTSWTLSGNDVPFESGNLYGMEGIDPDGISPNSGLSQAYFGDLVANATTLSQDIITTPDDRYQISWYLAQDTAPVSPYTNMFSASFGGTTLADLTALDSQGYTLYSYSAIATTAVSPLSFTVGNDVGQFLLDDTVVTDLGPAATPEPQTWLLFLSAGALLVSSPAGATRLTKTAGVADQKRPAWAA